MNGSLLLATLLAVVIGYLLGSLPIAVLLSRRAGVDIFEVGTGLPGASNVMRNVGRASAVVVLLGDMAKGGLAVVIAKYLGVEAPLLVLPRGRRFWATGARSSPGSAAATALQPWEGRSSRCSPCSA